jgi:AcrR family transcriptional regulator
VQNRSQRTRARVVEAARREFDERGYAVATARSIAERAGVGTGTFYHYFPDKDAVLRELARARAEAFLERTYDVDLPRDLPSDPAELAAVARTRLGKVVDVSIEVHRTERGLHSVMTERRLSDPELDAVVTQIEHEAVRRLARSLEATGHDGDARATAYMMFSLIEGAVHGHVLGSPMLSDERFREELVEALIRLGLPATLVLLPRPPTPG